MGYLILAVIIVFRALYLAGQGMVFWVLNKDFEDGNSQVKKYTGLTTCISWLAWSAGVFQNLTFPVLISSFLILVGFAVRSEFNNRKGFSKTSSGRGAGLGVWYGDTDDCRLTIGGIPVPEDVEPLGFVAIGSPGSGKSQMINKLLTQIRVRKESLLVADVGGEAMAGIFKEGDLILNPLDERSLTWSPFAEIAAGVPTYQLAAAIIPSYEGKDKQWTDYAQNILTAILDYLLAKGLTENHHLTYFINAASEAELKSACEGTSAARLFEQGASGMKGSAMGILATAARSLTALNPSGDESGFSVKKWVESDPSGVALWLPYREDQSQLLYPLICSWMSIATQTLLGLETKLDRRFWLVADEFSSLGKVNDIEKLLTKGRKKGVGCAFGIQTVAQIIKNYGQHGSQEILACLQNWVGFRSVDAQTAETLEKLAGKHQFEREEVSKSKKEGFLSAGDTSVTKATRHVTESLILASEFQNLQTRNGFLKLAGDYPITKIEVPIVELKPVIPAFVPVINLTKPIATKPADQAEPELGAVLAPENVPDPNF